MNNFNEVIDLEKKLLQAEVRKNPDQLNELLATSFFEFGSSGKVWSRDQIIDSLPMEDSLEIKASDFQSQELGPGIVLITYKTLRETRSALRSSIWKKIGEKWQMVFHQGTIESN